jgi:hypothetical protein
MTRSLFTPHTDSGRQLEQALSAWIDASRRACEPGRDLRDEQAENAAWHRVQSMLATTDALAAA